MNGVLRVNVKPLLLALPITLACTAAPSEEPGAPPSPAIAVDVTRQDTVGRDMVPAGFGSLRQDDVAVRVALPAVSVRMIPLDEEVLRLLSPDSYRALRDLSAERAVEITRIAQRHGAHEPTLWYVSWFGVEAEARFDPGVISITGSGRVFRPLDILPLTPGWGEQRLRAREVQSAIYVFGDGMALWQPLTITVGTTRNEQWTSVVRLLERERALVRTRAGPG